MKKPGPLLDEAVDVARLLMSGSRGYETQEKALKALGRHVPGHDIERRRDALEQATALILAAIDRVERAGGPTAPSRERQHAIAVELQSAFPQFSADACQHAAGWGVFWVWK